MGKARNWKTQSLILATAIAMWLLAGCQADTDGVSSEEIAAVDATAALAAAEGETAVSPTAPATEEPPPVPTEAAPVDNCLDCHINKDLLIQTADPEEEVIHESEGEG